MLNETSSDTEFAEISQSLDRSIADGSRAVASGQLDCATAERQLADLERSIGSSAAPTTPAPAVAAGTPVRGITDREIRFGMAAPFSGAAKELGRQMKLGIETAFNLVNESGGVEGRALRLVAADDGYEATRTGDAMKQLYDKEQVFGFIGNVGTSTAAVSLPMRWSGGPCSSAPSPARRSCAMIRPIAMCSTIAPVMRKKPTRWCAIWSRSAACSRGRSPVCPAGPLWRCRLCRRGQGDARARHRRQRHSASWLQAQFGRSR
jgi:hypothetical protein